MAMCLGNVRTSIVGVLRLVMGQKNQLWWDLPAQESFRLHQQIYGVPKDQFELTLNELTDFVGCTTSAGSTGSRIVAWRTDEDGTDGALLHSPDVLFLDEPTIGLDVIAQHNIQQFLRYYQEKRRITILLTSHYMKDVAALCKRVVIVANGLVQYDGSLSGIIDKFSGNKIVTLQFADHYQPNDLSKLGTIVHSHWPKVQISIARADVPRVLAAAFKRVSDRRCVGRRSTAGRCDCRLVHQRSCLAVGGLQRVSPLFQQAVSQRSCCSPKHSMMLPTEALDAIYRNESRRVFATLLRLLRDFDLAEEAMHEAFATAAAQWVEQGLPENPVAWLISTGRFKAIDLIRRRQKFGELHEAVLQRMDEIRAANDAASNTPLKDDQLRLIFTCCHPAIDPSVQVPLTLREVCGLTTDEIASAFLVAPVRWLSESCAARQRFVTQASPSRYRATMNFRSGSMRY